MAAISRSLANTLDLWRATVKDMTDFLAALPGSPNTSVRIPELQHGSVYIAELRFVEIEDEPAIVLEKFNEDGDVLFAKRILEISVNDRSVVAEHIHKLADACKKRDGELEGKFLSSIEKMRAAMKGE